VSHVKKKDQDTLSQKTDSELECKGRGRRGERKVPHEEGTVLVLNILHMEGDGLEVL
jgi:hypothetical protein